MDVKVNDMLFCYEPTGCCSHADADASEVAWLYGRDCQPSRWVSVNGDPINKTPPFRLESAPMNVWGRVVLESGFFGSCGKVLVGMVFSFRALS